LAASLAIAMSAMAQPSFSGLGDGPPWPLSAVISLHLGQAGVDPPITESGTGTVSIPTAVGGAVIAISSPPPPQTECQEL
jgi:hypothetical protein